MKTFIINNDIIKNNIKKYKEYGTVLYAAKTNFTSYILEVINNYVDGFMVSNIDQLDALEFVDINKIRSMNTLNNSLNAKLNYISVESVEDLIDIDSLQDKTICIRIAPRAKRVEEAVYLGTDIDNAEKIIKYIDGKCKSYGIGLYLPRKVANAENFRDEMIYISCGLKNYHLDFISIGGISKINNLNFLNDLKDISGVSNLILEVGEGILNDAVDLKTNIIRHKILYDKHILIINSGIYDGMLDKFIYNKKIDLFIPDANGDNIFSFRNDIPIYIYGNSTDSKDYIGKYYIKEKDIGLLDKYIFVKNVGAYFNVFETKYGKNYSKYMITT